MSKLADQVLASGIFDNMRIDSLEDIARAISTKQSKIKQLDAHRQEKYETQKAQASAIVLAENMKAFLLETYPTERVHLDEKRKLAFTVLRKLGFRVSTMAQVKKIKTAKAKQIKLHKPQVFASPEYAVCKDCEKRLTDSNTSDRPNQCKDCRIEFLKRKNEFLEEKFNMPQSYRDKA